MWRLFKLFNWTAYLNGLLAMLSFGLVGWLISLPRKNVTHVDSMWSLFFILAVLTYLHPVPEINDRAYLILSLVIVWASRLSIYLTWRNWGPHEDHRYQEIRKNNEPHFWLKSLYIIFGLQSLLAWIISLPLLAITVSAQPLNWLDMPGVCLWLFGFLWETISDWQLMHFKANPVNKGAVMNMGLWRYSRHPNYFGEFCLWWGYYLIAVAAGAWWTLPAPLLMTLLLLKVSGVALLEKDIGERRPAYAEYMARTNAFIPGFPKSK
ncbi:MAG TPA: DUF1295 domain-containing protein [Methylophilaceae bacterium]|jgi:steroid 5-alpha reductase family enzyme